jgi:ribosomal protein S18 acetylase RimI-like enzyme
VRARRVLDPARAICVVASRGEQVVGMAELTWPEPTGAQAGLLVEDAWQRRGIGSRLLRALAVAAAQRGFDRISCDTAREDRAALAMIHRAGFQTSTRIRNGRAQTSFRIPQAARPPSARTAIEGDGSGLGRPEVRRTPTPSASG